MSFSPPSNPCQTNPLPPLDDRQHAVLNHLLQRILTGPMEIGESVETLQEWGNSLEELARDLLFGGKHPTS